MSDLISRADAIEAVENNSYGMGSRASVEAIKALPSADITDTEECRKCQETTDRVLLNKASADADSDDLIIKGAKGIQDGLYNIKDGKLFKYKARGGTVRTYEIVPSAEAVEVVRCRDCKWYGHIGCAIEIKDDSDRPKPDDFCSFGERRTK